MTNEFTLENTKDATHYNCFGGGQFEIKDLSGRKFFNILNDGWLSTGNRFIPDYGGMIDLTDQTGRGYPTLEWFLKCGYLVDSGDKIKNIVGTHQVVNADIFNGSSANHSEWYVKSTRDNRHDLTAMARDEYYSKREKQWPNNDRIDAIGQNGNNGEHYESKPVYTQEMHDNGELPPVGSDYLDGDNQLCTCVGHTSIDDIVGEMKELVSGIPYAAMSVNKLNEISPIDTPIDTRTDEEKLRDALLKAIDGQVMRRSHIVNRLIKSNKLKITLNEEG